MSESNNTENKFLTRLENIEFQLNEIKKRNQKVELEKSWEVSKTRKISIVLITYLFTSLVFYILKVENYFANAVIPTLGYFLSTQSLPVLKSIWMQNVKIKDSQN